jgi:hypothetical protein
VFKRSSGVVAAVAVAERKKEQSSRIGILKGSCSRPGRQHKPTDSKSNMKTSNQPSRKWLDKLRLCQQREGTQTGIKVLESQKSLFREMQTVI